MTPSSSSDLPCVQQFVYNNRFTGRMSFVGSEIAFNADTDSLGWKFTGDRVYDEYRDGPRDLDYEVVVSPDTPSSSVYLEVFPA